jgi:signal transduction histidine kinase/ActR/RegA family two-component response regulator
LKNTTRFFKYSRYSLAYQLLAFTMAAAGLTALISVGLTFYSNYLEELRQLNTPTARIETGDVNNLIDILKNNNTSLINSQLEDIVQSPNVVYAEVQTSRGMVYFTGSKTDKGITHEYPLVDTQSPQYQNLGKLVVVLSDRDILNGLWQQARRDVFINLLIILVISVVFLIGFEILIGKHLRTLSESASTLNLNQLDKPFFLNRKEPARPDELSILTTAFNKMCANLSKALNNLKTANRSLAVEIDERKGAELALATEQSLLAKRIEERTSDLSFANAELARAARMKDEFMASMSHELRTPLAGILGLTEALNAGIYGEMNERQRHSVTLIRESGETLLRTINDILDLSRIQTNQIELEINPVTIQSICQSSLHMVKQLAAKKNITAASQVDPQVSLLYTDERRLKQILVNLLNNAVKFTPEGGRIGIEVRGVPERHQVSITIWDTGIGIGPEDQKELFKPFKQLDGSLARRYSGTGLGLVLVINLVEMLGGGLQLESTPNQGSRFTISLPWDVKKQDNLVELDANAAKNPSMFIPDSTLHSLEGNFLIVDDNELTLTTLKDYLTSLGADVMLCRSGLEAMERIKTSQPDVLLIDIQLPDITGLDMIHRLRQDPTTALLPIIALTALAMDGDRERCLNAGANEYMAKPFSLMHLAETLNRFLADAGKPTQRGAADPNSFLTQPG